MKKQILSSLALCAIFLFSLNRSNAQNVGIGENVPASKLAVHGNATIGSAYSTITGPSEGLIVEGQVGIGTTSLDTSAVFEINSVKQGVVLPRMNTAQRNGIMNPVKALLVFNTDSNCYSYYNGSAWINFATGLAGPTGQQGQCRNQWYTGRPGASG